MVFEGRKLVAVTAKNSFTSFASSVTMIGSLQTSGSRDMHGEMLPIRAAPEAATSWSRNSTLFFQRRILITCLPKPESSFLPNAIGLTR
jgi:hypothetical protein